MNDTVLVRRQDLENLKGFISGDIQTTIHIVQAAEILIDNAEEPK